MIATNMNANISRRKQYLLQIFAALFLFAACVAVLYRFLQHYVDPDSTNYLPIIKRYVEGDFIHAANGLWSPLHCWFSALLVKATGCSYFLSALLVNCLSGAAIIVLGQLLFNRLRSKAWEQWCFALFSAVYWSYAMYYQLTCDAMGVAFLLGVLLVLLRKDFFERPGLWLALALLGAFATLAKTYSFYFLNLLLILLLGYRIWKKDSNIKKAALTFGTILLTMLLVMSPWIWLLHEKYHIWTISLAGKLNSEWNLVGTQIFRDDIKILIPPTYANSSSYMEDPYWAQGGWHHLWDSPQLFFRFWLRIAFNFTEWTEEVNRLSYFYGVTWIVTLLVMLSRKLRNTLSRDQKLLALIMLVFPVGLWIVHIEARYIWITMPICLALGLHYFEHTLAPYCRQVVIKLFVAFYFLTYLPGPAADIRIMLGQGAPEYAVAQQLKELGIKGTFVCNRAAVSGKLRPAITLAYFAESPVYCYSYDYWTTDDILADAKRYQVKYYFYFYDQPNGDYELKGLDGQLLPEVTGGKIDGLRVFELKN